MRKIKFPYFLKIYIPFSLLLISLIRLIQLNKPVWLIEKIWVVYGFFAVLTPVIYILAQEGLKRRGPDSVLVLLGSNVLRMVISMSLALVFILKYRQQALIFAVDFFALYILFAVFEIHCLLHNLRLPKKENNSSN